MWAVKAATGAVEAATEALEAATGAVGAVGTVEVEAAAVTLGVSRQVVLCMKVLVVLRHGPCDVTRLALADYEHVHPLPVGQPLLVLVLQPDVLHHVELPPVHLLAECALEN